MSQHSSNSTATEELFKGIDSSEDVVKEADIICDLIGSPPAKKLKSANRDTINSLKISVLRSSHGKHYYAWSSTRKKAGSQSISKQIWPKV